MLSVRWPRAAMILGLMNAPASILYYKAFALGFLVP